MQYQHPTNHYVESANLPGLWCLLFGPFYFLSKGIYGHAIIHLMVAIMTAGISIFIYPLFAARIVDRAYLRVGWIQVRRGYHPAPARSGTMRTSHAQPAE